MNDKRVYPTKKRAIAMLPDKDQIHTFMNPAMNVLVGADWDKKDIVKLIKTCKCELAGKQATAAGHGLAIWKTKNTVMFVETKKA